MNRFKDILFVVEPEAPGQHALERAISLAKNNQADLMVVAVTPRVTAGIGVPEGGPISEELQSAMVQSREQRLQQLIEPYRQEIDIQLKVLKGTPFVEIIHEVLRGGHDLVIKTPEHLDWMGRLFGSDDMHLLRKCPCPVWLIKPEEPKTYRRILAAVDVEQREEGADSQQALNMQILEMASSMALAEFAELHIVHVWDAVGEGAMRGAFMKTSEEQLQTYVEGVRHQHEKALGKLIGKLEAKLSKETMGYLKPQIHMVKGWARKEIPQQVKRIGADVVLMGTVGRTGVPGLIMGNTAETILNQIDCSVLAIKPPGFETPLKL